MLSFDSWITSSMRSECAHTYLLRPQNFTSLRSFRFSFVPKFNVLTYLLVFDLMLTSSYERKKSSTEQSSRCNFRLESWLLGVMTTYLWSSEKKQRLS